MTLTLVLILIASVVTFIGALVDDFVIFAKNGPDSDIVERVRRERIYPALAISAIAAVVSAVALIIGFFQWALGG